MPGHIMHMAYVNWLEEHESIVPGPTPVPPGPVPPPGPEVLTIDGLEYRMAKIGGRVWMAENCQAVQGTEANFWTATNEGQTNITCVRLGNDTKVWTQVYKKSQYLLSVRLVKD